MDTAFDFNMFFFHEFGDNQNYRSRSLPKTRGKEAEKVKPGESGLRRMKIPRLVAIPSTATTTTAAATVFAATAAATTTGRAIFPWPRCVDGQITPIH